MTSIKARKNNMLIAGLLSVALGASDAPLAPLVATGLLAGVVVVGSIDVSEARGRRVSRARHSSHHSGHRNVNRNVNRNIHRDVDIDVDWDHHHHPVARGVAFGTAAAVTAAAVGSVVYSLPGGCRTVVSGGIAYRECGGIWYAPQYQGSQVVYVVVNAP